MMGHKNQVAISSKTVPTILISNHLRSFISTSSARLYAVMLILMDEFAYQGKSPASPCPVLC
jgi:hypothetical protein